MTMVSTNWWASPDHGKREGSPGDGVEEAYRRIASSVGRSDSGGWAELLGKFREGSEQGSLQRGPFTREPPMAVQQQSVQQVQVQNVLPPPPAPFSRTPPNGKWSEPTHIPTYMNTATQRHDDAPQMYSTPVRGGSPTSPGSSPGEQHVPSVSPSKLEGAYRPATDKSALLMEQNNALREAELRADRLQKQVDELQRMLKAQQAPAYRPPLPPKRVFPTPIPQEEPHVAEERPRPASYPTHRRRSSSSHQDPYGGGQRSRRNSFSSYNQDYEIRVEDLSGARRSRSRGMMQRMQREADKVNFNYGKHLVKMGNIENKYTSQWADSLRSTQPPRARPQWNTNLKRDIGWLPISEYDRQTAYVADPRPRRSMPQRNGYHYDDSYQEDEEEEHPYGYPPDYY